MKVNYIHVSSTFCIILMLLQSMTLKEALKAALTILKQVMEEKLNETNIEVMTMTPEQLFHMFTKAELQEVIKDIA